MKKRFISIIAVLVMLCIGTLTSCSSGNMLKKYTISFYDDSKLIATLETHGKVLLTLPEAPDKNNYEFVGWFFDQNIWQDKLTEKTFVNRVLTEDVSVFAYYREQKEPQPEPPKQYTVMFETNGGSAVKSVITHWIEVEPETTKPGYKFAGWYMENNYLNRVLFPYEVTGNQTLYAKWENVVYTVMFETNGGSAVKSVTTDRIEVEPETTKPGYKFAGWYMENNYLNRVLFPYEVTGNQTLYAKWDSVEESSLIFIVDEDGILTEVQGMTEQNIRVNIPQVVSGKTIIGIGQGVFQDNKRIESLVIPDTVKSLGYQMCRGCSNLKEVILPDGLTVIPDEAFEDCISLQTIDLPNALRQIRSDAFTNTGIVEIKFPDSLTEIWQYVFKDCRNLEKVDLANVESLGNGAFQNCTALRSISLPNTLISLAGNNMFSGCTSLKEINMPDKPVPISYSILNDTGYYNDTKNWVDGVLFVDGYLVKIGDAFSGRSRYKVPEGTIVIADYAFYGAACRELVSLTLPNSLLHIGAHAFNWCNKLANIEMKDNVRSVGYDAFSGTAYASENANWVNNGLYVGNWLIEVKDVAMDSFVVKEGTIGVADGKDTALFPARAQGITELILPMSLKYIGVRSFARTKITEVMLPEGLERIGEGAFSSCFNLQKVNLGDCRELKSIGESAFMQCAMRVVTIPQNVVSMGELVFNHNTVDLTIYCQVSEKPAGWNDRWAYSYRQGITITVSWKE